MRWNLALATGAAASLFAVAPGFAADTSEMAKLVHGFYDAYATFHPSDGIPDAKGRAKYEPFITPGLNALLLEAGRADDAFSKANKNAPPLIEGDLFTSNFEGATSFKVGACSGDAKEGQCEVALTYDDRKDNPGDKPVVWSDTAYLHNTASGWRVDDIGYGASWAFANKGKMTATLHQVITDAAN